MINPVSAAARGKGLFGLLKRACTITSHYGFTSAKMDSAVATLTDLLQQFGCRATLPVTAIVLSRHSAIFERCQAQGTELAVHGLLHADYTRLPLDAQREHLYRARQIFDAAGVRVTGFRCPYLRWNTDTLSALSECDFTYDSSQTLAWNVVGSLETDAYRRVLAFYGAQAATDYPSLPRRTGDLVRIPYCVPDDEAFVERLQLTNSGPMIEMWAEVLYRTHKSGELFTLGLHPERIAFCKEVLRAILEKARSLSPQVWIARLGEIATWWRALEQTTFEAKRETEGAFEFSARAPPRATILVRALKVNVPTQPWARSYRHVPSKRFSFQSNRRPFIGLSPGTSLALHDFVRQQGYLVEISTDARAYSLYLDRASFTRKDERPLLEEIEQGNWPLVRLARWPDGAGSALCVTGDIDACTIWDYGLRAWER